MTGSRTPGQAAQRAAPAQLADGQQEPQRPAASSGRHAAGRRARLLGAVAAGGIALAYVGLRNPHDPGVAMPRCPIHWATGLDCPGCGGLRMTHDLLHGDLVGAWRDNAFLLLISPLLLLLLGQFALAWSRGEARPLSRRLGLGLLGASLGWMAVRNLFGW